VIGESDIPQNLRQDGRAGGDVSPIVGGFVFLMFEIGRMPDSAS
jgi:hypothetical protein